jgi:hypothetical protein
MNYEELRDGCDPLNTHSLTPVLQRRALALPIAPPQPPARWVCKAVEEKRQTEAARAPAEGRCRLV